MITGLCLIPSPHALSIPCRDNVSGFLDPGIWQALSRCCAVVPRSPRGTGAITKTPIAETPIAAMGAALRHDGPQTRDREAMPRRLSQQWGQPPQQGICPGTIALAQS